MSFCRPYPRQRRTCEEHKAELEEENYYLHSELQTEVDINRQNERRINQLERDYSWYGYVDNRATTRDILIDQIKRATRQIRQKENNLRQDIIWEKRRRYDAETVRDNEIIRRQNAEGVEQMVIANLY
ncbi:hypothetical protein RhiirC2_799639 [Rhizophagus irregularis]|uniref:Uncharacterized protein n=1 Tax=Rhizophagus irregularis TaxID=588596 RepID=A0A2N1M4W6_9GLOM|nr:hypothetical protein RhiirC2_799639 [Rhizophagus irregularis]